MPSPQSFLTRQSEIISQLVNLAKNSPTYADFSRLSGRGIIGPNYSGTIGDYFNGTVPNTGYTGFGMPLSGAQSPGHPLVDESRNILNRFRSADRVTNYINKGDKTTRSSIKTPEDFYNYIHSGNFGPAQAAEIDRVIQQNIKNSDDKSALGMAMSPGGALSIGAAFLGALGTAGAGPLASMFGKTGGLLNKGAGMIGSNPVKSSFISGLTSMSPTKMVSFGLKGAGTLLGGSSRPKPVNTKIGVK